jgi:hypothetical protein
VPIGIQRRCLRLAALGHHGADAGGGREQRRRLALDHLQVLRLGGRKVVLGDELQHLALGDGGGGGGQDAQHFQ